MDWIGFLIRRTDPINFILWPTLCRRAAVRRPRPGLRRSFHCTYHHRTQKERAHTQALDSVGFPNIETLVAQRDAIKVFKAPTDERAPRELRAMFTPRFAVCNRKTRSSDRLHLQKCRLTASQKAYSYRAAVVWNRLPPQACAYPSLTVFKTVIQNCSNVTSPT